jgi:hypothetical protein
MLNERQLEQRERMPIIDQGVATKLSLMFKDVYAKQSQYLDRHGDTLNTEAFLQGRRSHDYKIFDNDRLDQGLTFYILTDMSGSMGENVLLCSDIVATFFKAVEHLPKIKIKAFGFTNSIHDLDLISVAKRSECHKLGHAMGGTPTHYALREIKKHMQKDSSKKFLIVLTDGSPNSFGYEARRKLKLKVSPEQYCGYLVQSIKKMHVGIFGLMLGFDDYKMKQIFNDDYTSCNTMIEVKDKMISLLQKQINIFLSG